MEIMLDFVNVKPESEVISASGLILVAAAVATLMLVMLRWRSVEKVVGGRVLVGVAAGDLEAKLWTERLAWQVLPL